MSNILDIEWYCPNVLKIKTKIHGIQPLKLRKYQVRYLHWKRTAFSDGIIRGIVLKPRQAGFTTLEAADNTHKIATRFNERALAMADKFGRTMELQGIYSHYVNNIPNALRPMIAKNNHEEILFDNPTKEERHIKPGLASGIKFETGQDKNAGRAGTRTIVHLSEHAFFPYALDVDEGVQNSVPLAKGTSIIKESTANGMAGDGEAYYVLWEAALSGNSIYKGFFVAWYEIDDYQLPVPSGFILTKTEIDLISRCPEITHANLAWRRLKISEYSKTSDSFLSPEERFKQDFPSYPEEAFLSTGRPVFDQEKLKRHINFLRQNPPKPITVNFTREYLSMYPNLLTVFKVPEKGRKYVIGADVAEGVEGGDASSARVYLADTMEEVAFFHGLLDPDHFGNVLVDLALVYHEALIVPEINNMGHTTLEAIKKRGYLKVYMRTVKDEIDQAKFTLKMGWRTTAANKQSLLNGFIARYRDSEIRIMDVAVLMEMLRLTRGDNGQVELNGKDRVVATCLAIIGLDQLFEEGSVYDPNKKPKVHFESKDLSRELVLAKRKA
jgi:hypothetical protein